MPNAKSPTFYMQFCYRCGGQFIRLSLPGAKPVLCGECQLGTTLDACNDNLGQVNYAHQRLALWYAEQAAFQQASKLPLGQAYRESLEEDRSAGDDMPF